MTDTTYNGWKNWETWNVLLWASNEEHLYKRTTRFAQAFAHLVGFDGKCQSFFRDMFPQGTPDMNGREEMSAVDWHEIAEHLKEWND